MVRWTRLGKPGLAIQLVTLLVIVFVDEGHGGGASVGGEASAGGASVGARILAGD